MKTPLRLICLTLLAAVTWSMDAVQVRAQTPFEPAAVVNDQVITRFDLDQRLRAQSVLAGVEINSGVARAVLNSMIADQLRLQAATDAGITVSDDEIDAGVEVFAQQRGMTVEEMSARLRSARASMQSIRDLVRAEYSWREVVRRLYGTRSRATEADVERELELLSDSALGGGGSAGGALYEVGFLTVALDATASAQDVVEATSQLREARKTIRTCEELANRSTEFGPGSGVRTGMTRDDLPPPLRDGIANLVPGQFADPVRVVDAVVTALLCSINSENASDQRAEEIRRQLVQRNFERYADSYLQELRRDAVIEIR